MDRYEIFKADGLWFWRLIDKRDNLIAVCQGTGYKRRSQAIAAARRVPELADTTAIVENLGRGVE